VALVLQIVILVMVCNCRYRGFGFPVTKINCLLDHELQSCVVFRRLTMKFSFILNKPNFLYFKQYIIHVSSFFCRLSAVQ